MKKMAQVNSQLLYKAIEQDNLKQIKNLLADGADLTFGNSQDRTPIVYAAEKRKWNCVELFCGYKTDAHDHANYGKALLYAAQYKQTQIAVGLLNAGARFKNIACFETKFEALHWAIENNDLVLIEALLVKGADPNVQAPIGSALKLAYQNNNLEAARLLLRYGAKIDKNLYSIAAEQKRWQFIDAFRQHRAVKNRISALIAKIGEEKLELVEEKAKPWGFTDAITQEIMRKPVHTADGQIYDKSSIKKWLKTNDTSPLTNQVLKNKELTPATDVEENIAAFLQKEYEVIAAERMRVQRLTLRVRQEEIQKLAEQERLKIEPERVRLAQEALKTISEQEWAKAEQQRYKIAGEALQAIRSIESSWAEQHRPVIAGQVQESLGDSLRLERFKAAYYQAYQAQFFKNPRSKMKQMLDKQEITRMSEIEEYVSKHPSSRSAYLLASTNRAAEQQQNLLAESAENLCGYRSVYYL